MKSRYYFSLFSSVFLWKRQEKCLFYNSENGNNLIININSELVDLFVREILNFDNLYCLEMEKHQLSNTDLKLIVNSLIEKEFAEIVVCDEKKEHRPINIPPMLNLQSDINRLRKKGLLNLMMGINVLDNLHELEIIFPNEVGSEFTENLLSFLSLHPDVLNKITIKNCKSKNRIHTELLNKIEQFSGIKEFVFSLSNISIEDVEFIKVKFSNFKLFVNVETEFDILGLQQIEEYLNLSSVKHEWCFKVTCEASYLRAENTISQLNLKYSNLKPFFEKNIDFFENNVYMEEKDFKNINLTKKEVFANQVLNTNNFGKFVVNENGKVHGNLYFPAIGSTKDDIRELVYKEMTQGETWLHIRNMKPCSNCIYQWLCPSPSDYELAIGKPNLCHVKC